MKWNIILVIVSLLMLFMFATAARIGYMSEAEAIAEKLAPQVGINEDLIRQKLENILLDWRMRRIVVNCSPLSFVSFLLVVRLIADIVSNRKQCQRFERQTSMLAFPSLVLSILSIFLGPFGFLPGIVTGHLALREIRNDPKLNGRGIALTGLIIGYFFLALSVVLWILIITYMWNLGGIWEFRGHHT